MRHSTKRKSSNVSKLHDHPRATRHAPIEIQDVWDRWKHKLEKKFAEVRAKVEDRVINQKKRNEEI
jgi:hypothetical protein